MSNDKDTTVTEAIVLIILLILAALYRAWVTTLLWSWFLVPLGVPRVGVAQLFGIGIIVRLWVFEAKPSTYDKTSKEVLVEIGGNLAASTLAVVIGAVLKAFL